MAFQVDPVTGLQNTNLAQARQQGSQDLSSVDFLNLIITQMRNQNPLDPQSDSDFMAQMAQFEALNQMKAVAEGIDVVQGLQELSTASALIGREVTGKQVSAVSVARDSVSRELFGRPYGDIAASQQVQVNRDERVMLARADAENAGAEVRGVVDRVVVGSDGIPMLFVNGRVVDLFTVSEVQ